MGGEPVGTPARGPGTSGDTRARSPAPAALRAVRRAASWTGGGGRDFRPGMTPLSASDASVAPGGQGGFPDCAGPAEASRDRARGPSRLARQLSALRVPHSPEGLQPEPGPAHRARPQPAPQPRGRAAWPVLAFRFVALSCPKTSPDTHATRARGPHRNAGLIRSGEFCPLLWSHSENSSHQHIKEDAMLPRPSMHRCLRRVQ